MIRSRALMLTLTALFAAHALMLPAWLAILGQLHCDGAFLMRSVARGHDEPSTPPTGATNPFQSSAIPLVLGAVALTALGVACVVAAGVGGYLGTRQNAVPAPASAMTSVPAAAGQVQPSQPVQETEAVVGEPKTAAVSTPAPAPPQPSTKDGTTLNIPFESLPKQGSPAPAPAKK